MLVAALNVLALYSVLVLHVSGQVGPEIFTNWASGTFIDRAPGFPPLGSPVFTFAYTQAESQLWYYTYNFSLPGIPFTLHPPPPNDNIFVGVKDNKLRMQALPTLFTRTYPPYDPTVNIFGVYETDLVITASRKHGEQLTVEPLSFTNPLQQWREFGGAAP